jgi:hypothetical protein
MPGLFKFSLQVWCLAYRYFHRSVRQDMLCAYSSVSELPTAARETSMNLTFLVMGQPCCPMCEVTLARFSIPYHCGDQCSFLENDRCPCGPDPVMKQWRSVKKLRPCLVDVQRAGCILHAEAAVQSSQQQTSNSDCTSRCLVVCLEVSGARAHNSCLHTVRFFYGFVHTLVPSLTHYTQHTSLVGPS